MNGEAQPPPQDSLRDARIRHTVALAEKRELEKQKLEIELAEMN